MGCSYSFFVCFHCWHMNKCYLYARFRCSCYCCHIFILLVHMRNAYVCTLPRRLSVAFTNCKKGQHTIFCWLLVVVIDKVIIALSSAYSQHALHASVFHFSSWLCTVNFCYDFNRIFFFKYK